MPRTPRSTRASKQHQDADAAEKNRPLVEDIRLLGRILGDVIREQEGRDAYELIERIRQLSVAYRLKRDAHAGQALGRLLKHLSSGQTVSVVRAFSYFSHLANIAEDRHTCGAARTTRARGISRKARSRSPSSASPRAA